VIVLGLLVLCIAALFGYGMFILHDTIADRPVKTGKRVQVAAEDAQVAEQEVRKARADAEKDIIEAKRRQLLDAVLDKDEDREKRLLLQLEGERQQR